MTLQRDDRAEATIISQLMIIGITAGIVFVAATYAFFAVDTAIAEADHAGAQLTLRGEMHRIEALVQQGVNASTVISLPHQGDVSFAGFYPLGASQDRLVIAGANGTITFGGLDDGDDIFEVCDADGMDVTVTWHWTEEIWAGGSQDLTAACADMLAAHPLDGVVSIRVEDAGELVAVAVVADMHLMTVETGGEDDKVAAWAGNFIINGLSHVTSELHVQGTDALSLRLWAINGPSFSTDAEDARMLVRVTDQKWLAQAGDLDAVTISAYGPRAGGMLSLYEQHGATVDGDTATFDTAHRLDIHGTAMEAEAQR